jgi:hypothetical protein
MTFTEAAVHVLRLVGKPLHYKEITDVAIEKDLLSHVGKSPEVTMGARLAAVVKKGGEDNPLSRVKPGVFALSEWDQTTIDQGLADRTPALKKLAKNEAKGATAGADLDSDGEAAAPATAEPSTVSFEVPPKLDEADGARMGQDEIARAAMTAAATEIFAPEDDDDEPILGGSDDDDDEEEEESNGRRRRRRRRRGRSGEKEDGDLPSYTVSEASEAVSEAKPEREARGEGRDRDGRSEGREREPRADGREREARSEGREREARGEGREREPRAEGRDREGRDRDRGGRDRDRDRAGRDRDREGNDREGRRARTDEGGAADMANIVEQALGGFRRQGGATFKQVAEVVAKQGRDNDPQLAQWLNAACRADNIRREASGERARFRFSNGSRIALWEWVIDKEQFRLEREARAAVDKYGELARQRLARRFAELPPRAFGELATLLLESLGFSQFRAVKRPSAHSAEQHLAAVQKTATGEFAVAIVIRRDGRDIGREQIVDLRGSLHHYGQAVLGLYVTTGQVMSGAREEAAVSGATPVQFVDGSRMAALAEQTGVGVVRQSFQLCLPDIELFDALRSN